MCMLFVKPESFTLPITHFNSLKIKNPDGFSAYNKTDGSLFKTLDYDVAHDYLQKHHEDELVVHFRLGTSGDMTEDQLHGFDVCKGEYLLFHNGVLFSLSANYALGLSDTQVLVEKFKNAKVCDLINYLEKREKTSRFLLVNKKTKEFIIPDCATWNGKATFGDVTINYSNSYAIGYSLLDGYVDHYEKYPVKTNQITKKSNSGSSYNYYEDIWNKKEKSNDELTLELVEMIWNREISASKDFIRLYPDITLQLLETMMGFNDLPSDEGLPSVKSTDKTIIESEETL